MRDQKRAMRAGSFLDPEQLEMFSARLMAMRRKYIQRLSQLREDLEQNNCVPGCEADQSCRDKNCRRVTELYLRHKNNLEKIEAALLRIKNGEFGYCLETGKKISLGRLEVNPLVELCSEAQFRKEQYEKYHQVA